METSLVQATALEQGRFSRNHSVRSHPTGPEPEPGRGPAEVRDREEIGSIPSSRFQRFSSIGPPERLREDRVEVVDEGEELGPKVVDGREISSFDDSSS